MPRDLIRRDKREIAPGIWSDPISERRHDYDGAQVGFEAEIAKIRAVENLFVPGGSNQDFLNTVWDSALEIAAYTVETEPNVAPEALYRIAQRIRGLKKER